MDNSHRKNTQVTKCVDASRGLSAPHALPHEHPRDAAMIGPSYHHPPLKKQKWKHRDTK